MSALSKTVQKQIDKANALADTYYKSIKAGETPATVPAPGEDGLVVHPTTPPAPTPDPTPAPPGGEAAASTVTPATVAPLPQEGFEQKYKVLQGKYNAEVPRLVSQARDQAESIRQLREQLTATQTLLASLGDRQAAAPAGVAPSARTPATPVSLIKDEEVKEFGADLIDVVRRVAREEHATLLPEIERRVQPVAQRVEQVAQSAGSTAKRVSQHDEQSFVEYMTKECPTWLTLNRDQDFIAWLDQKDPFSGMVRGEMLSQAYQSHDGPRVVTFFNGYLKEHAAVTPTTPAPAAGAAPTTPPAPQRSLEQLVTPGTPKIGAASTPDGSGKRVWTRAEISTFYAQKSAGRYNSESGKARAAAMEADIFAAQREGRVR